MEILEGTPHVARETALDVNGHTGQGGGQGRHATLKEAPGSRMPRKTKRARRNGRVGWSWAVAGSLAAHGALLVGLLRMGDRAPAGPAAEPVVVDLTEPA